MAKIREELEIVSSSDLNSLKKDILELANEIRKTNGETIKPKSDSSEIDKTNTKLDALRKNAEKGIESKVKVVLDPADLKKLNNLPTAKMKIDFLVDKGALSKTIGKDLKSAIQTAYTQMRKKTNADRISQAELDKFIDKVPQLSGQARSSMITELQKKGIPESAYSSYETGYRLRNYVIDAKKSISSRGKFTTPSGSFAVPDISLSAEEYGKAMNELIQNAQNVVAAASFFEKENEKLGKANPNLTIPTKEDISSAKMKELTGFGVKVDKKNDVLNNYANYLSDQFTKKAGVYDIIDQAIAGTLDPSQLDISSIKNSVTSSLKTTKSTKTAATVNTKLAKYVDTYVNKSIEELEKDILNDDLFGKNALPNKINNPKSVAEKISDKMSTRKRNKFVGLMSTYLARNGSGIQNEDFYKSLLNDVLEYAENAKDLSDRKNAIEQAIQKQLEEAQNNTDNSDKATKLVKKKTVKKTTTKKQESTSTTTSQIEEADNIDTSTTSPVASTPKVTKPKSTTKKTTSTKKKAESVAKKEAKTETPTPVIEEKPAVVTPVVSDEDHKKNIQQIKDTEKAKEKEADTVVTANDKIADSEKAVTKQVVNSGKSQEDTIKTVSAIRNKDYDLTETPVTPSELDGLKQLSQKEFGDAEKYVKVYEDTNRTIYTLTQTYQKKFDQNGNLLAEGYKNVISYYDSYEKLESDAIKLSKRINSNYAKLDTERYKSTEKKNPNLIKKLQGDIKSDQQDLSELHRIARLQASNSNNDYTYQDFTQALRKGSAESSRALSSTRRTNRDNFNAQKETVNTDLSKQISDIEGLGQAGEIAASKLKNIQQALSSITTPAGLEDAKKQIEDINKQFDSNKTREATLNYVNNLEKGLTGKQTVSIGQKNSDWYENSVKNGEWIGPLADLNKKFEDNRTNTISDIDKYIAKAKMLGEVGSDAVSSFTNLRDQLGNVNTESGLEKIQKEMTSTQKKLEASKAQADQKAAALKNSETVKTYDDIIDKAKEVKSLNSELLRYKKQQTQYSEDSQTYKNIGDRIIETAEAAKKANSEFEELSKNNFVSNNSEKLKAAGKDVEDYEKVVREMKQAQDSVSGFDEKTSQAKNTKVFSEQYTDAITKVKELKTAIQDLYTFQAKGTKGQMSSDEFIKGMSDKVENIGKLQEQVDKFRNETYSQNANNKDSILNQVLFGNYEESYSDYESKLTSYSNDIASLMNKAYARQRKLSNELYKMAGSKNYSEQDYNDKWNQANTAQAAYESLKAQVMNSAANTEEVQKIFAGIKKSADLDRNNILGSLQTSLEDQINDFDSSLKHMQNTMSLPDGITTLRDKLKEAFTFEDGSDNIGNFKNRIQEFYQMFDSLKGSSFIQFANEFGTAYDKLTKAENSSNKVSAYTDKLNGFVESYNNIISSFHEGKIDTNQAQKEISNLASEMQNFQKVAKDYDKTTSKGTYVESSKGQVQDTKDVQTVLTEYAKSIGLTSQLSSNINETTGQVKMQFADISGNVVTLTGNLEKAGNAMRVISTTASKSSSGMTSFGNTIKGMVSGNFKGAIADIASYVSYFQVTMKAIQSAKEGFNTFLDYEKDLTNISYTMNMSPSQLQDLGSSAVDMAKDLSMSLDNTMDIYKIYANMNTTASEIQETAKPTAILSNLSGVDASTAADQVQGILQQFHMLEDGSTTAADASMHIVDVLDKVSGSVGIDYANLFWRIY